VHGAAIVPDDDVACLPGVAGLESELSGGGDLLVEGLKVENGMLCVSDRPGHGVAFTSQAWSQYRIA
jgi:hypothetical protein